MPGEIVVFLCEYKVGAIYKPFCCREEITCMDEGSTQVSTISHILLIASKEAAPIPII